MAPVQTIDDVRNRPSGYAVLIGQYGNAGCCLLVSNGDDLLLGQFGVGVLAAECSGVARASAPLLPSIGRILRHCSKPEVIDVHAAPDIAGVTHLHSRRDRAVLSNVGQSVCRMVNLPDFDLAISAGPKASIPKATSGCVWNGSIEHESCQFGAVCHAVV